MNAWAMAAAGIAGASLTAMGIRAALADAQTLPPPPAQPPATPSGRQ